MLEGIDEVEELLHPTEFAEEWRRACAEIDVELLYRRASADLGGAAARLIG